MNALAFPRQKHRPELCFLDGLGLAKGRAHELCGNARRTLAALVAAACDGPVVWIAPAWATDRLNPEALVPLFDPGRLLFVEPERTEDMLWCLEETLRAGVAPLAIADLPGPPALTPVRRLHLAAETGAATAGRPPLGLLLTPGTGGAPGVESRWQMETAHTEATATWHLHRLRARTAPVKSWQVSADGVRWHPTPIAALSD